MTKDEALKIMSEKRQKLVVEEKKNLTDLNFEKKLGKILDEYSKNLMLIIESQEAEITRLGDWTQAQARANQAHASRDTIMSYNQRVLFMVIDENKKILGEVLKLSSIPDLVIRKVEENIALNPKDSFMKP